MAPTGPPGGRVSGPRLATILGQWRRGGPHHGAADLAAAITLHTRDGTLPPGTRLPAERELATALAVSRTLVTSALERLRESGLVSSRRGSGSWITVPGTSTFRQREPAGDLIDFARASPPAVTGLLPAVDAARDRLLEQITGTGYSDLGLPRLRELLAQRYRARGLPTTPQQIMITNGAHHAFVLVLRTLVGPGDRVLVEQPSYPNAIDAVRAAHALPVPVAVDAAGHGWDLDAIDAALKQAAPRLAYLIIDFHNPTGLRMDTTQRQSLGAMLARARTPAVIDETLVELDFSATPEDAPPPLATFTGDGGSGNWAILVGSAAKTYWGGLRIGWIRASEELLSRICAARTAFDLGSPVLEQLIVAELLSDDSVVRTRRAEVVSLRDTLVDALREHCPEWTFVTPDGGLSLWCGLPAPIGTRLAVAAENHGVQIAPGSRFSVHGGLERRLRLPFTLPADRITDAVTRLSMAATSVRTNDGAGEGRSIPVT